VGCAGVPKGVDETVGVAVCVGVDVGDELGVDVGVPAEAVGVGSPWIAVAAGLGVLEGVADSVAAGSCAIAMPPSTAAYSAAQLRARRRIFFGDRLKGRASSHARGRDGEVATPLTFGIARPALEHARPSCVVIRHI
jgi:hypothetical protein